MTTDPFEAEHSRIREARREVLLHRANVESYVSGLKQARAKLREAEQHFEKLLDGETEVLPLFVQVDATQPAVVPAVSLDPITKHGQPPGTLGHRLGMGAIADPEPEEEFLIDPDEGFPCDDGSEPRPEPIVEADEPTAPAPAFDFCSLHPPAKTNADPAVDPFLRIALDSVPRTVVVFNRENGATDGVIKGQILAAHWPAEATYHAIGNYTVRGGNSPAFWVGQAWHPVTTDGPKIHKPTLQGLKLIGAVRRILDIPLPEAIEAKEGPPGGSPKPPTKPAKPGKPKPAVNAEAERVALNLLLCGAIELIPATSLTLARDKGATDNQVVDLLATAWGSVHNHNQPSPHRDFTVRGGDHPAFWTGALTSRPDQKTTRPALQGTALVARVRQLAGIPTPAAIGRTRRLNRKLDWQARADQRRVESQRPTALAMEGVTA